MNMTGEIYAGLFQEFAVGTTANYPAGTQSGAPEISPLPPAENQPIGEPLTALGASGGLNSNLTQALDRLEEIVIPDLP